MKKIILLLLIAPVMRLQAQSVYAVTEGAPINLNGLTIGYTIKSEEEKEVANKGSFSRFAVKFYVSNTTQESKIMLFKDGFNLLGAVSDQLAQFNCLNATGARFTSKSAIINASPCNVLAVVDDKDANGKAVKNKRFVQIGSWIKAGQTISANAIVIVPLNEKPRVEVVYLANSLTPLASAGYRNNNGYNSNNQNVTPQPAIPSGFVKIRNTFTNNYINAEKGPLACTVIDNEWWSAQWQIIPVTVNGTNYFTIQNRWKSSFLTIDNSGLLSSNGQSNTAMWVLDTQDGGNTYTIKNATRNAALADQNGMVETVPLVKGQQNARWVIEQ